MWRARCGGLDVAGWMWRAGCGGLDMASKKLGAVMQTSNISLEIFDLFIAYMWGDYQATIRAIGSWGEAWQAAMVINSAVPMLREKLAHRQVKEVGDGDLDIEWEVRHGESTKGRAAQRKKVFFSTKLEGVL